MADRSLQHRPLEPSHTRRRQASASSSDRSITTDERSTSSHPRRRRIHPVARAQESPSGLSSDHSQRRGSRQISSSGVRERSSRGSSAMTVPMDTDAEVTYTPTTHRISKAKKGKKVHVCEYPGCGKVFTRAEHRKRHEANHNPEPAFKCEVISCRKPFQRADLLARHMERQHEMLGSSHRSPRSQRSNSEASVNPPGGATMPHTFGQPQSVPSQPASHGSGAMSIGSIIEHSPMRNELSYHPSNLAGPAQLGIGPTPLGLRQDWVYPQIRSGDSPVYSSDSCSSPMSDYPNPPLPYHSFASHESIQRPPSSFSDESIHQGQMMSPHSAGPAYSPAWGTFDPVQTYNAAYVPTVGILGTLASLYDAQINLLNEAFTNALRQRDPVTSRSPISDLQTVLHMETFARYRSRSAKLENLHASALFKSLYSSARLPNPMFTPVYADNSKLIEDQNQLEISHTRLQQALPPDPAPAQLQDSHSRWVEHENRRRIFVAAFILETQNRHLLQLKHPSEDLPALDELNVPFPSSAEAWGCTDLPTWRNLVLSQQAFSIDARDHELHLDPFQSSLLTCRGVHRSLINDNSVEQSLTYHPVKCCILPMTVTHHALTLTACIPLHALVITASESWLFGTKIADEAVWLDAKNTLRQWVESDQALKATWHATELLRLAFGHHSSQAQQQRDQAGYLHDFWSIYVAA
ncbi:MAG: hypothetical protein Q9183_003838, partial [Haloplaca sp. 2 TL-2023]